MPAEDIQSVATEATEMDSENRGQERGKEKETFPPITPYREKESQKENLPIPIPFMERERERERERPLPKPSPTHSGKGQEKVDLRRFPGQGEGKAQSVRHRIDRDLIMDPTHDPVQVALLVLRIPKTVTAPDGRTYNNARILRWALVRIGEEAFRELVYRQWRENEIDGLPRSSAAAFMAKLNREMYAENGGAR